MTPHHAPAQEAVLPTAGHRIAHGLAAKGRDKTDLDKEIPGNAVRVTRTTGPQDMATTAPQRGRAISKDPTGRKTIVAPGPMPKTAHPGGAAARLARLAGQADAMVDGDHNILNGYSRGGSHVPKLHF